MNNNMFFKRLILTRLGKHTFTGNRNYSKECMDSGLNKGLVLGAYDGCNPGEFKLTPSGMRFNEDTGGKLTELLKGAHIKLGKAQVFANISDEYRNVAVTGLGSEVAGLDDLERLDECKENIRIAAGVGAKALQDRNISTVLVEGMTNSECAAEGSTLAVWKYQEYKEREKRSTTSKVQLFEEADREGWQRGVMKAECQNVARYLSETPSNMMTPTIFAEKCIDILCPCGVQVDVRDRNWLEERNMKSLLTISKGSCQAPLFLELGCCGAINYAEQPVVFVAKGVTFDTGGLNLKKPKGMGEQRGAMAGAAAVVGLFRAAAVLCLPMNINAFIPLCENALGGMAVKPGDVLVGINGMTIRVADTDHEGRVLVTDALTYSKGINPCLIFNIGTMGGAIKRALGTAPSAVWTRSETIWRELERAGAESGDRVWRMPLWKEFNRRCTSALAVDVTNRGMNGTADPCVAAAFLQMFLPAKTDFVNVDITGSGMKASGVGMPYLREGLMTGRPVRTLTQFLYQMSCPHEKGDECGPIM